MFGREGLKELKEALAACGCDMNTFKSWQRQYEKLIKQMPSVRAQYENALFTTQEVYVIAQELEKMIVDRGEAVRKEFAGMLKNLKKVKNTFDHEFIISREDREFHSTFDSILKLGVKALDDAQQRLILQSEIENLLALLKENLEKEEPQLYALCFFYQEHSDQELMELPPSKRVERIVEQYQNEFVKPIVQMLVECIPYADSRRQELENSGGRHEKRQAQQLSPLWSRSGETKQVQERAMRIYQELMDRGEEG